MLYFSYFPEVQYRIPNSKKYISATNITKRFAISNFLRNSAVTFDEYYVQDGERPETVAYDYYGDVSMDWLVLLTNEIHDPYFQWVLSYENINAYVKEKYGSVEYAMKTNHHYEQIIEQRREYTNADATIQIVPEKTLIVDFSTYTTLTALERKSISIYDYENEINETNRHIYLLDLNYLMIVKEQHPYIFDEVIIR
jgi:hypothetical protein